MFIYFLFLNEGKYNSDLVIVDYFAAIIYFYTSS